MLELSDKKIRRILILHTGAVGDFIQALPSIRAIRKHFLEAYIEIMGHTERAVLAENAHHADRVRSIERHGFSSFWIQNNDLPEQLIEYFGGFDLIVLYLQDKEGVLSCNLRKTGASNVITIQPFPPPEDRRHIIDYLLDSLNQIGIPASDHVPRVFLTESDKDYAIQFFDDHHLVSAREDFVIAIHPGSGGLKKRWAEKSFADIMDWVTHNYNAIILLISGPADSDIVTAILQNVRKASPVLVRGMSLPQLAALLEKCHCFLGVDSGITHLSAAVGTSTFAIFGPTDPEIWGPRGDNVTVIRKELNCSPCTKEKLKACNNQRCLQLIEVEDVLEKMILN